MGVPLSERFVIEGGDGAYVTTASGHRLLDAVASLWHANIGHGRVAVAEAMARQIRQLETYHLFGRYANGAALDLADRLAALSPIVDPRIFFTNGGSDAVDLACKLARLHWQQEGRPEKTFIASREQAYHGLHAFGTSIGGLDFNRRGYGTPSLVPETVRIPHSDLDAALDTLDEVGPERVAAIVVEPVMGTGGVIPPAEGYLEGLQRYCSEHDILYIIDEVITGFGRIGAMFATERLGLEADMVLFAKGVTSGYAPLGGVIVAPWIWGRFFAGPQAPMFRHGITYSGHATACAAATANLDILEHEELVQRALVLETTLADAVTPLAELGPVREVRSGTGVLAGVQLHAEIDGEAVVDECFERGVALRLITDNTVQISPPFIVTDDEVAMIADVLREALAHVRSAPIAEMST